VSADGGIDALPGIDAGGDTSELTGAVPTEALDDLDALLGDLDEVDPVAAGAAEPAEVAAVAVPSDTLDDLDALLGGLNDARPAADEASEAAQAAPEPAGLEQERVEALPAGAEGGDSADADASGDTPDDLDALLAGFDTTEGTDAAAQAPEAGATAGQSGDARTEATPAAPGGGASLSPFGVISAPRPEGADRPRDGFRMAIFGDFSGRAARGLLEIGDALAARRAIRLDVDTVERVIAGFATTIVLPIGRDGAGIEVELSGLDALHPDELYANVEIFAELSGLRQRLKSGSMAAAAVADLQGWGAEFGALDLGHRGASRGVAVPADRPLSAFQALIGDTEGRLARSSPTSDLIARIVAPHVVAAPSAETPAMTAAVDEALSNAMRLILHSPEFQAVEAQWRSLDLLARRIETDAGLQLVLYDVSAEELAVDLAAQDDLAESGLLRLLTEGPMADDGRGGFSALFGLYTFEETPPHAELLARIARIAAHVGAPFFTAISPEFLKTRKRDRHPLVVKAWDALRGLPEARYLGVASPRFLLRRPYGARSEPIDAFRFEEFTPREGLRGMLWANPAVLVAILLAASQKRGGKALELGSVMSIGDMPFHFMTDEHGDQVALPCTERNLTASKVEEVVTRGLMPVLSLRGRDEVRLGSFQSVGGGTILGPWAGGAGLPGPQAARAPDIELPIPVAEATGDTIQQDAEDAPAVPAGDASGGDSEDLDALLASFGDDAPAADPGDIDADLAALLEDL
jgi:hypothetical protein